MQELKKSCNDMAILPEHLFSLIRSQDAELRILLAKRQFQDRLPLSYDLRNIIRRSFVSIRAHQRPFVFSASTKCIELRVLYSYIPKIGIDRRDFFKISLVYLRYVYYKIVLVY